MKKFKDLFIEKAFNKKLDHPSVSVVLHSTGQELFLKLDSKDNILGASYSGKTDIWLSSLCEMILGRTLVEAEMMTVRDWDKNFADDQSYWEMKEDRIDQFLFPALELLKAAIDSYRGREYLYTEASPLVCRCFGIRESDILDHLHKTEIPTLETLAGDNKAGMGCRSCVPQLSRWLVLHDQKQQLHHYKEKPRADWFLDIDYMLSCFPESKPWAMEVKSFKGNQVVISFEKEVSQKEEEEMAKRLQDFLGASVDSDLGFFLRRARHFSKAKG